MVIAVDVDGTLFDGHVVAPAAITALARARQDGHLLVIVTGRQWEALSGILGDDLRLFHRVVAEEGGYLVDVATGAIRLLSPALEPRLVDDLRRDGVDGLDVGRTSVGAPVRFHGEFVEVSRATDGRWRAVVNKNSVALVPAHHDKGTGLRAALADLGIVDGDGAATLAIGDASNDLPMFAAAEVAVAVANADEAVRAAGIELTRASFGDGVAEALDQHLPRG